jgi:hypothetical protein
MPKQFQPRSRTSAQSRARRPRRNFSSSSPLFQSIRERTTTAVTSIAGGSIATSLGISPATIITAARLTGYRAIADEIRIDYIRLNLTPILGAASTGRTVLYVERDPNAAIVATVALADDQREKVIGRVNTPLSICWRPQEPTDREFQTLNPGSHSLGTFQIVSDQITDATATAFVGNCYSQQLLVYATLRGRP